MARLLRIKFPHAIYHVMARGNAQRALFHSDDDYQRIIRWQNRQGLTIYRAAFRGCAGEPLLDQAQLQQVSCVGGLRAG